MESRSKSHKRRHMSGLERMSSWRKRAVLGIYFGLAGIGLGVLLVVFRWGIFSDPENETVLGIFVFLAGYTGVLIGCSYWLKAKSQLQALVFIGLMPLAIMMVPFVRLIFVAAPMLLPVSMVMMPVVLIVVVAVLPNQSSDAGRKPHWQVHRERSHGSQKWVAKDNDSPE